MCVFGCDAYHTLFLAVVPPQKNKPKSIWLIWVMCLLQVQKSNGSVVAFARAYAYCLLNIGHKDFTITNFA